MKINIMINFFKKKKKNYLFILFKKIINVTF